MLAAYNLGDYQAFSRDLSLPARLIVDEDAFAEFRSEYLSVTGPFMAVTGVQPEPAKPGRDHVRYVVRAQFQYLNAVALVITLSRDGQVEGRAVSPQGVVRVMTAVVVFESMFGNTQQIAEAVSEGLAEHLRVDQVEVSAAPAVVGDDVELLVVGGPTHAFGLTRPGTRQSPPSRQTMGWCLRARTPGVARRFPKGSSDVAVACFDSSRPRLPGSAARPRMGAGWFSAPSLDPRPSAGTTGPRAWGVRAAADSVGWVGHRRVSVRLRTVVGQVSPVQSGIRGVATDQVRGCALPELAARRRGSGCRPAGRLRRPPATG